MKVIYGHKEAQCFDVLSDSKSVYLFTLLIKMMSGAYGAFLKNINGCV